ncbi:MAG TPA: hypothetical protein VFK41_00935 [Nocardioidaceae bacterium]|nr:hypothetical protein [Nocardioidaceae bacterium]
MSTTPPPRRRRIAGERRRPEDAPTAPAATTPPATTPPAATPPATSSPSPAPAPPPPSTADEIAPSGGDFPPWRFAAALVAALALVVTALVLGLVTWDYREVTKHDRIADAQDNAAAAAERAAAAVLTFSHDSLDADLAKAARFLSPTSYDENPAFRDVYTETFTTDARPRAIETQATVTATVLASAVVTATEERAQILVYVDQTTTSTVNGGRPQVALNRTTFDMVNEGGSWLVAGITSY